MVPAAEVRRLFGQPGGGNHDTWQAVASVAQPFDFETTPKVKPRGHVVAVRVTSEDPEDGFKPTSGRIQELSFKGRPDVWAYFSVKVGGFFVPTLFLKGKNLVRGNCQEK